MAPQRVAAMIEAEVPKTATPEEGLPADAGEQRAGTCLLCHAVDASVTWSGLAAGQYWRCAICGQMWDGQRLAAAANYAAYLRQRAGRDDRAGADTLRR
jgi:hypothetical protein